MSHLLIEQKWSDFAADKFQNLSLSQSHCSPPKKLQKSDLNQSLQYVSGLALETVQSGSRCL